MYKLHRRSNPIPFLLILAIGIAASILVPQSFPQTIGDIPTFALFPGEMAIALILSVLLFENASPDDLIKIAGVMIGITFATGALSNVITLGTVMMPEFTLKLNWVQLIAFNLTGLSSVLAYYSSEAEETTYSLKPTPAKETTNTQKTEAAPAPTKIDFHPNLEHPVNSTESNQDILNSLNVGRINQLEQTISGSQEKVSLESLFADETDATARVNRRLYTEETIIQLPPPSPQTLETISGAVEEKEEEVQQEQTQEETTAVSQNIAEPNNSDSAKLFNDVSADLDSLFADLTPTNPQKDFSPASLANSPDESNSAPLEQIPAFENLGPKLSDAGSSAMAAVREFGKLSATASSKDAQETGTLKTIGQMLLDSSAIERIIKQADKKEAGSNWRTLSIEKSTSLQALMNRLALFEGVESALLINKEGMLLSNTESVAALKYVAGPLSLAMHSTTNLGTSKLQMGELRQAVFYSGDKLSILTDVGIGILAVFAAWEISKLDQLLEFINNAVADSDSLAATPTTDAIKPTPFASAPQPLSLETNTLSSPSQEATASPEVESSLLKVSDSEVAGLFDDLLSLNSPDKKSAEANTEPALAKPVPDSVAPEEKHASLFTVGDNELAGLFDNLLSDKSKEKIAESPKVEALDSEPEKQAEPEKIVTNELDSKIEPEKQEEVQAAKKPTAGIKEFGKLSINSAKEDISQEQGSMKAIGRQLLDVQAVENIIKAGEKREKVGSGLTTARVISAARGEGIKALLAQIDTYDGVIGSLIVGHDGLVIAATLQSNMDKEIMGAMCSAMHSHLNVATKKLEQGKLQQVIFLSPDQKLTVLTSVAVGILAVFADQANLQQIDGLLSTIETTIRG